MKKISASENKTYLSIGFLKKLDKAEPYMRELMISLMDEVQSKIIVNKSDFDDLKAIVRELVEAQKKTEIRMEELVEAQKKTEVRMEELAEAQKETKLEIRNLRKQVGGLTMDVGYGIEDRIMPYICDFGKKEFDTDIKLVERRNLVYPDGNYDEINIYAEGMKQGKPVFIIGECKAQPGKKDFDKFNQITARVKKVISGDVYMFITGYSFSPDVEIYAKKKYPFIRTYRTYEFEMKYEKIKLVSLKQS
ncbi:MAG TPA: hypothetical protein DCQ37_21175 [Desulfobacteraceae bacterium]|nr:hypothetical protein [Desulfobacteraceae bacterium]